MLKDQIPNCFYFTFQSEPEEMPPEAKMRMKNIGRFVLTFLKLYILDFIVS